MNRPRFATACAAVALLATAAAPALAQRALVAKRGSEAEMPFTGEHMALLIERCALTPEQIDAADMLFDEFRDTFTELRADLRRMQREMKETDWKSDARAAAWADAYEQIQRVQRQVGERSVELQVAFLTDMKLLLTDEQIEQGWDSFERTRLRRAYLPRIPVFGLRGDVERTLDQLIEDEVLTTADVDTLRDIVERWELGVDRSVERVGGLMDELDDQFAGMKNGEMPDVEAMDRWLADAKRVVGRVVDAHDRASREIEGVLGPDKGPLFREAFAEDRYPRQYKMTDIRPRAERITRAIDDLTDDQLAQIDLIVERHEREMGPLRRSVIAAETEMIMEATAADLMTKAMETSDYERLETRAEELMAQSVAQLEGVLTPEQLDALTGLEDDEADAKWSGKGEDGAGSKRRQSGGSGGKGGAGVK